MAEQLKRYRVVFGPKGAIQHVTLYARNKGEAEMLAVEHQQRRHARFPLTFARLEQGVDFTQPGKKLSAAEIKSETERRNQDQDRYEKGKVEILEVHQEDVR
jgi:hypothetical protein